MAPAIGSVVGSSSEAFSGQTTRSGRATRPAATSAASSSVWASWLAVTARRWSNSLSPSRGTLPWIAATTTCASPAVGTETRPPPASSTAPAAAASATAGPATVIRATVVRRSRNRPTPPRAAPIVTTANVSIGAPPIAAHGSSGPSAWPNAIRPHGRPPNGQRSRANSTATHTTGTATGHQRRRPTTASASASSANHRLSISATTSQASTPRPRRNANVGTSWPRPTA
jgi:hypothetical protein